MEAIMKVVYPGVFTKTKNWVVVSIPDLEIDTQGKDLADAIEMARDAIGIVGIDMEDDNKVFPVATPIEKIKHAKKDIVSLVDVDLIEYREANERRTVRRNVSLPAWLNSEVKKAGINVSAILQDALKVHLGM
jgi:predicted RNase H-like HicB family nuclease